MQHSLCPTCLSEIPQGEETCPLCNTAIKRCPMCSTPNLINAEKCTNCAHVLDAVPKHNVKESVKSVNASEEILFTNGNSASASEKIAMTNPQDGGFNTEDIPNRINKCFELAPHLWKSSSTWSTVLFCVLFPLFGIIIFFPFCLLIEICFLHKKTLKFAEYVDTHDKTLLASFKNWRAAISIPNEALIAESKAWRENISRKNHKAKKVALFAQLGLLCDRLFYMRKHEALYAKLIKWEKIPFISLEIVFIFIFAFIIVCLCCGFLYSSFLITLIVIAVIATAVAFKIRHDEHKKFRNIVDKEYYERLC